MDQKFSEKITYYIDIKLYYIVNHNTFATINIVGFEIRELSDFF